MRRTGILLLLAAVATADRNAEMAIVRAIRGLNSVRLGSSDVSHLQTVRDLIVNNVKNTRKKAQHSVVRQLNAAFDDKRHSGDDYYKPLAEALGGCGKAGIQMLKKRIKGSKKKPTVRRICAEALGSCDDPQALKVLLGVIQDKEPAVAAAAVTGCASYAKVKEKQRKTSMRTLINRYLKVTSDAAGKARDSKERKMYDALKPAMNDTLKAFSGGESLDSAEAWDAWLRENVTKPWS